MTSEQHHGKELFSTRVEAGSRTYFIDVREAATGTKYLKLTESRWKGDGHEHDRVMVFEEYVPDFMDALTKAVKHLEHKPVPAHVIEARKKHARAYEKWTEEEDVRLGELYRSGNGAAEMSSELQRKPGAIKSRLKKLGLEGEEPEGSSGHPQMVD